MLNMVGSMKAILIARVSTEEQKEAGNSLPDSAYFGFLCKKMFLYIKFFILNSLPINDNRCAKLAKVKLASPSH